MATSTLAGTSCTELSSIPMVWMYHSIAPYSDDPFEVTMTPRRFEAQMAWLRRRGLRGVCMRELLHAAAQGRANRLVGLTFDDGYRDFITNALPILERYKFSATVFVLAGRIGGDNEWSRPGPEKPLLTADDIREVSAAGIEIGSHGLRHISLVDTSDAELRSQTAGSRSLLEDQFQQSVQGFCYPYGHHDARVVAAARAAGYDYACAVGATRYVGRHAIPRTLVHERDSSLRLEAKRLVSALTVGNSRGVRYYKGGK